jgi:hypothetical protein
MAVFAKNRRLRGRVGANAAEVTIGLAVLGLIVLLLLRC